jgi:predicted glutamine amidotransferase
MCGIVGAYSKDNKITAMDLIIVAYFQRHRGKKDGLGIVDVENNETFKTSLRLDEIYEGKIIADRYESNEKSKRRYWEKKLALTTEMLTKWESRCMFLHHRKATVGDVCLRNTHPIKSSKNNNILYMHNGSCNEVEAIRQYSKCIDGIRYSTETDTEVLGNVVEQFKSLKLFNTTIVKNLTEIFEKFGVLIRFDMKKKEIEIFKDDERSLFIFQYPQTKTHTFFVSEPTFIYEYDKIDEFLNGYLKIAFNEETKKFFLQKVQSSLITHPKLDKEMWTTALENSKKINCREISCDSCGTFKMCVGLPDDKYTNKDLCPACWVKGLKSGILKKGETPVSGKVYQRGANNFNRNYTYDRDKYDDEGALSQMENWIEEIMTT